MSHFYGTLQGSRGEATRCGDKGSGLVVHAAGWGGAIRVSLRYGSTLDRDLFSITHVPWHGSGKHFYIAEGVIGEDVREPEWLTLQLRAAHEKGYKAGYAAAVRAAERKRDALIIPRPRRIEL